MVAVVIRQWCSPVTTPRVRVQARVSRVRVKSKSLSGPLGVQVDPIRSASRIRSENRDTPRRICFVGYLFFRVKFEPFSARVQVKSRVSKFSSRLGLDSESRTRVLQHWYLSYSIRFFFGRCFMSFRCTAVDIAPL